MSKLILSGEFSAAWIWGICTCTIAGMFVLVVVFEKGLGIDVPGVEVGPDWLTLVLGAFGLGTLSVGIANSHK